MRYVAKCYSDLLDLDSYYFSFGFEDSVSFIFLQASYFDSFSLIKPLIGVALFTCNLDLLFVGH